jgi:pimeloyl-ACP methyl ester carboxylesterase
MRFILVHGSWHTSWAWSRVTSRLATAGHVALAINLPGRGSSPSAPAEQTLAGYTDAVVDVVDAADEPVIVVGHSAGGCVISQVAEARPDGIAALVYVAGFLLPDGTSLLDVALADEGNKIMPAVSMADDDKAMDALPEHAAAAFYNRCTPADQAEALSHLVREAAEPSSTPVRVSADRFGRVPRGYVFCTDDQAISIDAQRSMERALPCAATWELESDHSPMLCVPDALTAVLIEAASSASPLVQPLRPSSSTSRV